MTKDPRSDLTDAEYAEMQEAIESIGSAFLGLFFGTKGIGMMLLAWYVRVSWVAILLVIAIALMLGVLSR